MRRDQNKPAPEALMLPSERRRLESFQGFKASYSAKLNNAERKMNALEERVRQLEDDAAALLQIACSAQEVAFALRREWLSRETQAEQQSQNVQDESLYDFIRRRKRYKQDD